MSEMVGGRERRTDLGVVRGAASEWPERLDARDEHVLVAVDALEAAAGQHERLAADDRAVRVIDLRADDQVDLTVLIFEQHEDDAVCGGGPLPRDRQAGNGDLRAVRNAGELDARDDVRQVRTQELERMDAYRERDVLVVGEHPLPVGLAGQLWRLGRGLEWEHELARAGGATRRRAELPEQVASRAPVVAGARGDDRLERVDPGGRPAGHNPHPAARPPLRESPRPLR